MELNANKENVLTNQNENMFQMTSLISNKNQTCEWQYRRGESRVNKYWSNRR